MKSLKQVILFLPNAWLEALQSLETICQRLTYSVQDSHLEQVLTLLSFKPCTWRQRIVSKMLMLKRFRLYYKP